MAPEQPIPSKWTSHLFENLSAVCPAKIRWRSRSLNVKSPLTKFNEEQGFSFWISFSILTWCFLSYKLTHRAVGHRLLWPLQLEARASWCSLDGLTSTGVNSDFIYDQRHQTHVTGIYPKVDPPPFSEFENFSGVLEPQYNASQGQSLVRMADLKTIRQEVKEFVN